MAENDVNRLIDMLYERVEDAKSPALKPNLRRRRQSGTGEEVCPVAEQLKRAQELLAARDSTPFQHPDSITHDILYRSLDMSFHNLLNFSIRI